VRCTLPSRQLGLESAPAKSETPPVHWKKVTLIGVGLLGGSLGLALRQRRLADSVIGFVRRTASVTECEKRRAVDLATTDVRQAVSGAELVVLCTPIAQMGPLVEQMLPRLEPGAIVTDVGSVKASLVDVLEPKLRAVGAYFVGSHPMAGSEKTGVAAARGDLFHRAVCVVTPTRESNRPAVRRVIALWKALGSSVLQLSPELHDAMVSRSSHLPHVVAAQLANLVLNPRAAKQQAALCANGFRDTTRIASGSPEMWRDIALANRGNLIAALDEFISGLSRFQQLLKRNRAAEISRFFEQAKARRDTWSSRSPLSSPE
jgi:prephenate dehydrogenase